MTRTDSKEAAEQTSAAAQNPAEWMQRPERSNMLMLRIMTWISLKLGRPAGRAVLHLITVYFLLFAPRSREASRNYLNRVFKGRNGRAGWRDIYRHIYSFASTIHDRVYMLNQRFDLFQIDVHGEELMKQAIAGGQGVFLIGAHMGSFEVIRALGRHHAGLKVAMAMYEQNARKINQILSAINPAAQQDIIGLGQLDSMLKVSAYLDEGKLVGMLADRSLGNDDTWPVTLLGDTAHLPVGAFRMAAILRRPVIFMTGLYLDGNRYEIHFEKLADFSDVPNGQRQAYIHQAIERYAQLMEHFCRYAPYNWFNFFNFWQKKPEGMNK